MNDWDEEESPQYEGNYDLIEDILASNYVEDILAMTKRHVEAFFQDKSMYCGGPIPKSMILSARRLSQVTNTDMGTGIDLAYGALEKTIDPDDLKRAKKFGLLTEDIRIVRDMLEKLARSEVPKCLAGGMMLLSLEHCEGVRFS